MKVNKSKLFKNAWKCIRKWKVSLSTALKMAWTMAKKELEYRKYYGISECYYFKFNLWSVRNVKRAYISTDGMSNYWNKKGHFVDFSNM